MFSLPRTGGACVLYRTPHTDYFTRLVQHSEPEQLVSLHDLPLSGGYVVMPFVVSPATPLLFIRPDEISRHPMAEADAEGTGKGENGTSAPVNDATTAGLSLPGSHATDEAEERGRYARSFSSAHSRLLHGELQKMVLSRRLHVRHGGLDAYRLFLAACHSRPGCFVALWWTAATGCWLVATPEPMDFIIFSPKGMPNLLFILTYMPQMTAAPAATSAPGTGIHADPTANLLCVLTTLAISFGRQLSAVSSSILTSFSET